MVKLFPFWKLKPAPYQCPSGEKILNPGFEIGNLNNWNGLTAGAVKDGSTFHSGLYSVKFPGGSGAEIYQLVDAIRQDCIKTFGFFRKTAFFGPAYGFGARILYDRWTPSDSDNPAYTTTINIYTQLTWAYLDMLPSLEPAKGAVIGLMLRSIGAFDFWADDVTLEASGEVLYP